MKKSKLIELLNSIEGDPEVFIRDSGEGAPVKIHEEIKIHHLARLSLQYWREMLEAELLRERGWDYLSNRSLQSLTEEDKENIEKEAVKAYSENNIRQSLRHDALAPFDSLFEKWYDEDYEEIVVLYPMTHFDSYFKISDK